MSSCQLSTLALILEYNTINHSELLSDNFDKDISLGVSNNNKEEIKTIHIKDNDYKNSRPVDINKQRLITLN